MKHWFEHILYHTRAQPETPAIVLQDRVVTYGMLRLGIERCAQAARSHIPREGAVAVLVKSPIRHLALCFALQRIGIASISLEHGQADIAQMTFAAVVGDREARAAVDVRNRFIEAADDWFALDQPSTGELPEGFTDGGQLCASR